MNYSNVEIRGNNNTVVVVQDKDHYKKFDPTFPIIFMLTMFAGLCYAITTAITTAIATALKFVAIFIFKNLFFNSYLALGIFIIFCVIAIGMIAYKSI